MTNNAQGMYRLNLEQCVNLLKVAGSKRTFLMRGDTGAGKSSMLKTLAKDLPTHIPVYFDCTTKDLGDIMIPDLVRLSTDKAAEYVTFVLNEELGMHHDRPIILMIDEFGKANPAVKNALLRLILERQIGNRTLHPDSIVFATTNLGAEGLGDTLLPHVRNRIGIITVRKPSHMDWIEYGINNGVDHALLGWVKDNPQLMQSFTDVERPEDNPYIYHPREQRESFVTPRSLEAASDILKLREGMDSQTLTAALMGIIGDRAAMDLMAFVTLADQLPTLESIKKTPETATVPDSASATCMVVYRTLATIDTDWVDAWMVYLNRMSREAQAMFANGVRAPRYHKQAAVMTNRSFTQWAMSNNHLFGADKV